jgi:hypothetical protein
MNPFHFPRSRSTSGMGYTKPKVILIRRGIIPIFKTVKFYNFVDESALALAGIK